MKRLLVTGGAGFIGSEVVRLAVGRGYEVLNFDALTYSACLANLDPVAHHPNYEFFKGDVVSSEDVDRALAKFKPDGVLHLAAESHVDRSIDAPGAFLKSNTIGTYNMLNRSMAYWSATGRPSSFRFLHVSTDEVFGSLKGDELFTEASPYNPSNPYSASKAASDHLVNAWFKTFELPTLLTNCSNNYGWYHFPEKFIPLVITNALKGKDIPIYGDGTQVRDWLHVSDHADALLTIFEKGTPGRRYNIGGNNEITNIELVKKLCEILQVQKPTERPYANLIKHVDDRPGHDVRYAIDSGKLRRELAWTASTDLDVGLSSTVEWYIKNEQWWRPLLKVEGVGERLGKKQ